jgi:hypothetical protein
VTVVTGNVRQRDDEDAMDIGGNDNDEEKVIRPLNKTFKSPRSSSQQLLLGPSAPSVPSPPVALVAFPQANLQITTVSDGASVGTIPIEQLQIEGIPQEEFVDDNRDLPDDF